ncbi:TPA: hypothetical protein ACQQIU_002737 [Pseudomonas aeruginosa]|uniref:hypothetical protein n=1 Tax=Pseudomonadaceae TaxID=135621 RepID=UPI0013E0AE4A|nr:MULTISPECIES: hypothetical protein [Pseudomonas]MBX6273938.1 hypothetical protein [Pseudomonas aeruginosa]QUG89073.1 hypothetical protein GR140_09965 [Pseudomonas putida]
MADEAQPKVTAQETKGGRRKAAPSVSEAQTNKQSQEAKRVEKTEGGLVIVYH